jgi:tetratricopeptide (TPR) repeat protein
MMVSVGTRESADSVTGGARELAQSYPVADNVLNMSVERYLRHAGDLFIYEGEYESALLMVDKTLEIDPKDVRALGLKGDILYCLNRDIEALDIFNRVLKINPASVEVLLSKACTLEALGRSREALLSCQKALSATVGSTHYLLATIFEQAISLSVNLHKYYEAGYLLKEATRRLQVPDSVYLNQAYKSILSQRSEERLARRTQRHKTNLQVLP